MRFEIDLATDCSERWAESIGGEYCISGAAIRLALRGIIKTPSGLGSYSPFVLRFTVRSEKQKTLLTLGKQGLENSINDYLLASGSEVR